MTLLEYALEAQKLEPTSAGETLTRYLSSGRAGVEISWHQAKPTSPGDTPDIFIRFHVALQGHGALRCKRAGHSSQGHFARLIFMRPRAAR
jgi:hypothetical protein